MAQTAKRVTKEEKLERIETLLSYKGQGYRTTQLKMIAMRQWGVSGRQAFRYLEEVKGMEMDLAQGNLLGHLSIQLNRLNALYAKAQKDGNSELALKVTVETSKLYDQISKEKQYGALKQASPAAAAVEIDPEQLAEIQRLLQEDS